MDLIRKHIRDIPDFPRPGILFKDITPLLAEPEAFSHTICTISELINRLNPDVIIGVESRGFIFGAPVAAATKLPFVPVRKPGKLPGEKLSVEYSLEYGSGKLDIHSDAFTSQKKVVVIDDLLATGGTAQASAKLVELLGSTVIGFIFVVELTLLDGRKALKDYRVESLVTY